MSLQERRGSAGLRGEQGDRLTRMYKALSELFLNSLMVANTDSMRQEKTNRKLEESRGASVVCLD